MRREFDAAACRNPLRLPDLPAVAVIEGPAHREAGGAKILLAGMPIAGECLIVEGGRKRQIL
jgi:hypothetical protein